MFKIHTKNGQTEVVDISDNQVAEEFVKRLRDQEYQLSISGVSILQKCGGKTKCPVCNKTKFTCQTCGNLIEDEHCKKNVQYSLSRPKEFRKVLYIPEHIKPDLEFGNKGGERIVVFVDGIKVVLMVHENQPASRVSLAKPGNLRYNPL